MASKKKERNKKEAPNVGSLIPSYAVEALHA